MDILSVAGFALNVYSYFEDKVAREVPKTEVVVEQPVSEQLAKVMPSNRVIPGLEGESTQSQQSAVKADKGREIEQREFAVEELLAEPAEEQQVTLSDKSAEATKTGKPPYLVIVEKRKRKVTSGVNSSGQYYLQMQ